MLGLFQLTRMGIGLIKCFPEQDDARIMALCLHDFHDRSRLRHDDRHRHAQPFAMIGQTLCMIARRGCNHAGLALFFAQLEEAIQRPPLFISSCKLEVFKLQPDIGPGQF